MSSTEQGTAAVGGEHHVGELPIRPSKEHLGQFHTTLLSLDFVQWSEFKRYADEADKRILTLRAELASREQQRELVKWEAFCDAAYYDMWCVRPVGESRWGHGFHLVSKEEAEGLRDLLSSQPPAAIEKEPAE